MASNPVITSNKRPLGRLFSYARTQRRFIWMAITASVLNKIFDLAPPVLIGAAIDVVVKREDSIIAALGVTDVFSQLVWLAGATLLIWGLESVFQYAQAWLWRNLAQTIQHELRLDAYAHIQDLELAYFHEQSSGGLLSILNDDINQLERFLDAGADQLISVMTTALVVSAAFFILAPGVAWMAMAPIPLILWGSFKFQRLLAPRYAHVREQVGLLNGQLANNLSGIATIKSFTTEDYERARIEHVSSDYREANRKAIVLSSAFSPLIRMVIVLGFIATLVYGGHLALEGELPVGVYTVLVFMTQRLLWPLTRLGETFDLYQRAMASTNRVMDLLETPIRIDNGEQSLEPAQVAGAVHFDNITFGYPNRDPILKNFDLKIPAGATVGIVGATGSGKTTLINLLLRFYEPQSGKLSVDETDISKLDLTDLRRAIGLVSQQVFLFHGTVSDNIGYGTFDASAEEIERAATLAEADEFIAQLPQGYQTMVGERGETLSGGQRQRLSIARALLKNPPILIFDEATSAVDNDTEAAIQRSLNRVTRDRTTLIIAHRLSTVRNADFIVVLDKGGIAEQGSHDELIAANGDYARLWRVQTGDIGHLAD
ncbi:ABC transporter ATP-binding protein [Bradymonas sediminis]|uniref:ABC transporter n=1 Tax=Bradymonas sediminis TaxID=1548548 RepID=A0A2Z4FNK5_9DELT|nr:ABC transporter ATP-binding protein [Bradymonas sediminis]AWV90601.1 ABC transporter [Bradymonas sediminis]TDP62401.1 ATP-binding cassette subfamily B protein [Bradymonas sediminis]